MRPAVTRRGLLKGAAGAGLALTFTISEAAPADGVVLAAHLHILPDNTVTLVWPVAEMGQGSHTGLALLLAEELDPDWERLAVRTADLDASTARPDNMRTAGSDAIMQAFEPVRRLGATARRLLITAAAQRWSVPESELQAQGGSIVHAASSRRAAYGTLAAEAARLPLPTEVALSRAPFRYIGKAAHRVDARAKSQGAARFGIDVDLPGMLTGVVVHCPSFGGRLRSVDPAPALAIKGVVQVVSLPDAVVVLGRGFWPASRGAAALSPQWDPGPAAALDDDAIGAALDTGLATPTPGPRGGDVDKALSSAARSVTGRYDVPYLSHWAMEPINATAWVRPGQIEVWGPVQGQSDNRKAVAAALGAPIAEVAVHTTYIGGSFGRRMQPDVAVQAALASRACGKPVKLVWPREQDTRHGFYRPRAKVNFSAAVDAAGRPHAIRAVMAENSTLQDYARRNLPTLFDDLPQRLSDCMTGAAYGTPNFAFDHADVALPVPVGAWHSVQFSHNGFFGESIIDELAHLAGQDPLAYRLTNLVSERHRAVLARVRDISGWGRTLPKGRGMGVAMVDSFGTVVAQVVEVSVRGRDLTLHKAWCAVDCGVAVNPAGVETQMVTGLLGGLSAALFGEINIDKGGVTQSGFEDDRLIRMRNAPPVVVSIVETGAPMGGAGESGLPPAAAALANAIFAASGERVRALPLARGGWQLL